MYSFGSGCDIFTLLWERGREVMSMIQVEVIGLWLESGHWNKQATLMQYLLKIRVS